MAQAHFRKQGELSIECDVQYEAISFSVDDPNWSLLRRAARSVMTVQKCAEHLPIQRAESIQFMYDVMKDPQVRSLGLSA